MMLLAVIEVFKDFPQLWNLVPEDSSHLILSPNATDDICKTRLPKTSFFMKLNKKWNFVFKSTFQLLLLWIVKQSSRNHCNVCACRCILVGEPRFVWMPYEKMGRYKYKMIHRKILYWVDRNMWRRWYKYYEIGGCKSENKKKEI